MSFIVQRDEPSTPFFDAAAEGRLLIRRCAACGQFFAPQQSMCTDGSRLDWVDANGTGSLISWINDHTPGLHPMLTGADGKSGLSALIELDEGPWISAALVDIDLNTSPLHAGDAMAARFVRLGDDSETIPVFTRA